MIAHGLPLVPDGAQLVANGKQALSLVAQDLRSRGVRTLLAPDHYCLTMIEPFQLEGLHVRHVATDKRALMKASALRDALNRTAHAAVLHCEVYGARAHAPLRQVLEDARARAVPVVVDATHSLLSPWHDPTDYAVASLRKLLPLPDGAFVTGTVVRPTLARRSIDEAATRLGLYAIERQRDLQHGSQVDHIEALDAAEEAMLDARQPADMSAIALQTLGNLSVDEVRAARLANARYLLAQLHSSGLPLVNPETPECGVVVQVADAAAAERDLLAVGIVCPISWPRPAGLALGVSWRSNWITLPVGPELRAADLERAAAIVGHRAPAASERDGSDLPA